MAAVTSSLQEASNKSEEIVRVYYPTSAGLNVRGGSSPATSSDAGGHPCPEKKSMLTQGKEGDEENLGDVRRNTLGNEAEHANRGGDSLPACSDEGLRTGSGEGEDAEGGQQQQQQQQKEEEGEGKEDRPSADLPDDCMLSILARMPGTRDRNAFSLASRHCKDLEASSRTRLRLGAGVHSAAEAVTRLSERFTGLTTVHLDYLGWDTTLGPQLGDDALQLLVSRCALLADLSLSYCGFVTDVGMSYLAQCATLKSLRLNFAPCVTGRGLLSVVLGCPLLETLHVERCLRLRSSEWLEAIGCSTRTPGTTASAPNSPLHRALLLPAAASATPLPLNQDAAKKGSPGTPSSSIPENEAQGDSQSPGVSSSPWQADGSRFSASSASGGGSSARRSFDASALYSSPASTDWSSIGSPSMRIGATDSPSSTSPPSFKFTLGSPQTPPALALCPRPYSPEDPFSSSGIQTPMTPPAGLPRAVPLLQGPVGIRRLTISNCRGIGEGDLVKLGKAGWERLEELRFDMDLHPRDALLPSVAPFETLVPDLDLSRMRVLSLSHCPKARGEGLALILYRLCTIRAQKKQQMQLQRIGSRSALSSALQGGGNGAGDAGGLTELRLVSCPGLNDADIRHFLSSFSSSLRVLSLSLVKWLGGTAAQSLSGERAASPPQGGRQQVHQESTWAVTTASLWYIAEFCTGLEDLELICRDEFASSAPLFHGFADAAVSDMVSNLPCLRRLRVGKGLHLSDGLLKQLRRDHRDLVVQVVSGNSEG